jgi:5-methylthioadenosine/S-adenosylhomocysteine deaminase
MENLTGSIEPGKKANFILVDTASPHATPMYNLYSQVVYALKAADVFTVIIGGKPVMEDRKMLTIDEATILEKANEYRKQVLASFTQSAGKSPSTWLSETPHL